MEFDVEHLEDTEKENDNNKQTKKRSPLALFNFTSRSHLLTLSIALVLSIASGIVIPAFAVLLGKIFDIFTTFGAGQISGPDLVKKISVYGIALAGLGSGSGLLNAFYLGFWLVFGELQARSVREKLFDSMLEEEMGWYDMHKIGIETLISRQQTYVILHFSMKNLIDLCRQIRELQLATSQPLGSTIQYTVTIATALGLAFYYSWSLTLITLVTVPISALVFAWISKRLGPSISSQNEELAKASNIASKAISAIDIVKCFNGQDAEKWQYAKCIGKAASYFLVEAQIEAAQAGLSCLVIRGMFVQGFWYGSHLVSTGQKNPGEILTAFWACLMAMETFQQILPELNILAKGKIAGARLEAMVVHIEKGKKISKMVGGTSPLRCDGQIEINNVSFFYPSRPDQRALENASFLFPAGETTFIVGRSGSGKSTLGNLLMRFYDAKSGDMLIDGHHIQTLNIGWLRDNITLIQQQNVLFDETLFKNIALGRKDHTTVRKQEMKRSIEMALLQHTISDLPRGLDTMVGHDGNALSGGQKQRVALARARLRNTPILILDEATSALDHISKSQIMKAIRNWRQGKTTIIITHDMSQVQDEDYTYVLEEGIVVQEGFRGSLGKHDLGPFQQSRVSTFDHFLNSSKSSTVPQIDQSSDRHVQSVFGFTEAPDKLLDIQSQDIRSTMSGMLTPFFEGARSPRFTQRFVSQLSPPAFPMRRGSSLQSAMLSNGQRGELPTMKLPDTVRIAGSHKMKDTAAIQMQPIEAAVLHQGKTSRIIKPTISRPLSMASVMAARTHKRKSRLTQTERDDQVAPLKKIIMTVWPTLSRRNRFILVVASIAATIHAAATPVFSFIFAKLLATFYLTDTSQRSHQALVWSLSVLGVGFVDSITTYSMHYLLEYCGQAWIDSIRAEAFKRILDQPRSWFDSDRNNLMSLTECLERNAEEMRNLLGRFVGPVYVAFIMTSMAVIWSLVISWKLTLVGLASSPYIYVVTRSYETVSGRWENRSNQAGSSTTNVFAETFSSIRTVRALTLEAYFHKKYAKAVSHALKVGLKRSAYSGIFFGLMDSGVIFITALIFYYGSVLVSSQQYSTIDIITVITMLLFTITIANQIVSIVPQINSSRSTATQLLRLAHLPYKTSHEHTGHVRLSDPGPIIFENTTFTYPTRPTVHVLSSFNLTLAPSTMTALVGASGSGKSTIASLLLGLYPSSSGTIRINNIPISTLHLASLRSLVAIVPQRPIIFPATIAQNIAYALPEGSPLASFGNIKAAAVAAGIDDFIKKLSAGYATLIGDGGTKLSGGQEQRIAIARAIVRRPKLLVLDEATSGLDGESAEGVRDAIATMARQGMGVLAITHDKEMMKACGEVVVMKGGRVCERGQYGRLRWQGGELTRLLGLC